MHYSAQELVDMLNQDDGEKLTVRKIRYYAQIEMLSPPELINGKKKYTDKQLEELRAIRKLQKTGTSLETIKKEIRGLDVDTLSKVGENAAYFSQKSIIDQNVYEVNADVALLFSHRVSHELKSELVEAMERIVKKHKGEL